MMPAQQMSSLSDSSLRVSLSLWGFVEPKAAQRIPVIEPLGELPFLLDPSNSVWSRFRPVVALESGPSKMLEEILRTRLAALEEALHLTTDRRAVQRARIDALIAFSEHRYRKAEGLLWHVLASQPGEPSARVFLAEALIAQRLWLDAQDVLIGLSNCRGEQAALIYAKALRRGFESGLYQRLGTFP